MNPAENLAYKKENSRYRYYYQRLQIFYQKPVTQVSTAVLLTIGTIIFFAAFAIRPTLQTISELLRKIEDQKKVLALAEKKSASLATAQEQYIGIEPSLYVLDSAVPKNIEVQSLLRDIESTAGTAGIPISNIAVQNIEYPPKKSEKEPINELKFSLAIDTNYVTAKQFISSLTKLPRLIAIDSISFSPNTESGSDASAVEKNLILTMNCRAFYILQ